MTFFYDLNKKLDGIRATPEVTNKQLNEQASPLTQVLNERATGDYSAVKAAAGKDIGKPGKNFSKIAAGAAKRYGSKEAGERVAGAVLNKLRHPKEGMGFLGEKEVDEAHNPNSVDAEHRRSLDASHVANLKKKAAAGDAKAQAALQHLKNKKERMSNDFASRMERESVGMDEGSKPDFLDIDKDGNRTEPMKSAARSAKGMKEGGIPMTPKQQKFAKLAKPFDKITFADKIVGAKKEVDEMLGQVAADAMKKAVRGRDQDMEEASTGNAFDYKNFKQPEKQKPTSFVHKGTYGTEYDGDKEDAKAIATKKKAAADAGQAKRGRGRPKNNASADTGEVMKPDWSAFEKNVKVKPHTGKITKHKMVGEDDLDPEDQGEYDQEGDMAKDSIKTVVRHAQALEKILGDNDNLPEWVQSKLAKIESMMTAVDDYMQNQADDDMDDEQEPIAEKAVSKKQQRFMGMVHATQKGEKAPSKEVAKVAKSMGKKDAEDFASTKQKGLPEKAAKKTKEKDVEESTTSGSVATGGAAPKAAKSSGGFTFGQGIYDSLNREVEDMISESMSINMSMNNDANGPTRSLTVTATDEDATRLAQLLKSAGLGGDAGSQGSCSVCGGTDCGCDAVDESYGDNAVSQNSPDYPTNTEKAQDNFEYSGGLNKPKSTGQTTVPVIASQDERQESYAAEEQDALHRMMEMSGIREAKAKPDFLDMDKDGDKQEPMKKAVDDKKVKVEEADTEFSESIRRMREIAGLDKKAVDEEKTQEGNKFAHNVLKAKEAGKTEADLDGDGDMEKVRESIFTLTNQWKAYKG